MTALSFRPLGPRNRKPWRVSLYRCRALRSYGMYTMILLVNFPDYQDHISFHLSILGMNILSRLSRLWRQHRLRRVIAATSLRLGLLRHTMIGSGRSMLLGCNLLGLDSGKHTIQDSQYCKKAKKQSDQMAVFGRSEVWGSHRAVHALQRRLSVGHASHLTRRGRK